MAGCVHPAVAHKLDQWEPTEIFAYWLSGVCAANVLGRNALWCFCQFPFQHMFRNTRGRVMQVPSNTRGRLMQVPKGNNHNKCNTLAAGGGGSMYS
jgi:hypothetical protein